MSKSTGVSSRAGVNAWVCWGGQDGETVIAYQRSETRPGPEWAPLYPASRVSGDSYRPYDGRSEWESIANEAMASAANTNFRRGN